MKLHRWTSATIALLLMLAGTATTVRAAESVPERIALKAARGVDNTVLGLVAEWPKTVYYQSQRHGIPYGATVGVVQGLAVGVTRTVVGLYELSTFPIPAPANYRPILSPSFSLEPGETRVAE